MVTIFFLFNLVDATRMARMARTSAVIAVVLMVDVFKMTGSSVIFQGVSFTGNSDSFVSDGRSDQDTAPRAYLTRATHANLLVCTWLEIFGW